MKITPTRQLAALAALVVLLGACSSPTSKTGLSASVETEDEKEKPSSPGGSASVTGAKASDGGDAASVVGNAVPPGSTSPQKPPQAGEVLGPGVLRDRIRIGYLVPDRDWDGVFAALGTPGSPGHAPAFGDQQLMYEAIVKDLNAHGGIAGRPVEPYYFTYSFNRGLDPASSAAQSQEACSYWTQDNRMFIVTQVGFENWILSNCLVQRKVLHVDTSTYRSASNYRKIADYYYNIRFNSLDRQARDYGFGLGVQGFFGKPTGFGTASKIGLIYSGASTAPDFGEAVKNGLEPELAKRGIKISERAEACTECTIMAKFRQEGITHVLFFAGSPVNPALFMQAAESQRYRPWYGIYTSNAPGFLLQYLAPPEQLAKSMGPGWDPNGDVAPEDNPYNRTPAERRCLDLMESAGLTSSDPLTISTQLRACLQNWLFQEVMGQARPNLTVQGFASAMAANTTGFYAFRGAALAYRFSADRINNGHVQFRRLVFNTSCACYRYTGPIQSMP